MNILGIGVIGVGLAIGWLMRSKARKTAAAAAGGVAPEIDVQAQAPAVEPAATASATPSLQPPQAPHSPPLPDALLAFRLIRLAELPPDQRGDMFLLFRKVPRPPMLMQQLLSPEFLNAASSAQLVDLIAAEPLIAARLLAVVNAPMYGLARPATSIDQAVMLLGVNSVRAVCLQYLMLETFRGDERSRAERLDVSWRASAIASELAQTLCQRLHLPDAGNTVSALVLSFLGRLAIEGTATAQQLARIPRSGFLERSQAEQAELGLGAAEIGRLILGEWGLPPALVADAADIDGLLTRPADPSWPDREGRLALAYFCARAGERLAERLPGALDTLSILDAAAVDFHHFRSYLGHPWLRTLPAVLASPAFVRQLERWRG